MDQEILYAKHAGIDYWAFDTYCTFGPNCSTNNTFCKQYYQQTSHQYCPSNPDYGLNLYLSSSYKSLLNFTLILLGSSPCDMSFQQHYIDLMKHPQFQNVKVGRPLFYVYFNLIIVKLMHVVEDGMEVEKFFKNLDKWLSIKVSLTKCLYKSYYLLYILGLPNPYMVLMDFDVRTVQSHAASLGFVSISTYALPGETTEVNKRTSSSFLIILYLLGNIFC